MRIPRAARAAAGLVVATVAVATLAGCHDPGKSSLPQPSKAFCDAATKYDETIQKPTKQTAEERARDQLPLVERMLGSAPADVKADVQTFADALRRRAAGDTSVVDDPKVEKAVKNVNFRAGNGCGFYQDQSGGGGI